MADKSELEKYRKRQNSMHGILIKISDMTVESKFQIVLVLRESLDKVQKDDFYTMNVSERVTNFLEGKYQGAWICIIGKRFSGNITHEPHSFLRASTQDYHILIYKLKFKEICLPKVPKGIERKNTSGWKIENIEKSKEELQTVENTPKSNMSGDDQKISKVRFA